MYISYIAELENVLRQKLYGQHLVQDIVVNALKAHWSGNHAQKPLTMSFHGWPGGGKNYVSRFIQDSMYKRGSNSIHVHHFMGRMHFPSDQYVEQYKVILTYPHQFLGILNIDCRMHEL